MEEISKMFIYGTVRKKGLCMENADLAEDEILDTIYDALEEKGYELELATNYVENNFSVENRQRREQRLIDANNIDWNGFSLTAAFAESVEVVLSHQKEIKPDDLEKYKKAENEGRLLLLPCEPSHRVYNIYPKYKMCQECWSMYGREPSASTCYSCTRENINSRDLDELRIRDLKNIGKDLYLSLKEARKHLKNQNKDIAEEI